MACILASITLFVLCAVKIVSCSKKSQEQKTEDKKPKTSSTSPSITASNDSIEKTCSRQTIVSKTVSVQNDVEKDKKDSSSSMESKQLKDCAKNQNEKKKSKESNKVQSVTPSIVTQNATKESDGKQTPVIKKMSRKGSKESQTIKKMSLEKHADREEDVKCDKEVSQKLDESERILHFSKKKIQKIPERTEENTELLEPTPLTWKE